MKIGDVVELKSNFVQMTITEYVPRSDRPFGCTYYNPIKGHLETAYLPEAALDLVSEEAAA